jgi:adenosine deaminase CECR1
MSHEFYQIMVGSPTISIHSWKQLALWSLEYSCLSDEEKQRGEQIFMKAWEAFCGYVVKEYGTLVIDGKINVKAANKRYGIESAA